MAGRGRRLGLRGGRALLDSGNDGLAVAACVLVTAGAALLVLRLSDGERNAAITHSIVDLGHRLGLNVVAEASRPSRRGRASPSGACDEVQGTCSAAR